MPNDDFLFVCFSVAKLASLMSYSLISKRLKRSGFGEAVFECSCPQFSLNHDSSIVKCEISREQYNCLTSVMTCCVLSQTLYRDQVFES